MQIIATLGPSVRLVVVQFHVKNEQRPLIVPEYSDFHKTPNRADGKNGVRVMEPTPDVMLELFTHNGYQLIDAWVTPEENDPRYRSNVRYVFCCPEYVNPDGLRPDFLDQRDAILDSLSDLINKNLWKTMGHLNPFFIDGQQTDQKVLMFDCNSRKETVKTVEVLADVEEVMSCQYDEDEVLVGFTTKHQSTYEEMEKTVMVFQGGRDKLTRQGIGPMVPLTDKAHRLKLVGDEVVLEAPEPVTAPGPILQLWSA